MSTIKQLCESCAAVLDSAPNPPATAEAIAKLDSDYGRGLPEDYRAFLALHDGWAGFGEGEYDLYPISGEGELSDREQSVELFSDQADFDEWVLDVRERVFVLGGTDNTWVVYVPDDGTVVEYSEGEALARHASFAAFLEATLKELSEG